ncbi:O-methyltransferase [Melioribacter sp. Ez-97]|uniref:O-methyltransferase n=1 Tax=Melioribacter sp. Ez-97 TaxID=3423434 RepID=UPI003ED8F6E8
MPDIINKIQTDYLKTLRRVDDPLIAEMEEFAVKNKIPILDWKAAELLEQLILISRPKRTLEIGMAIGYSTIRMAKVIRKKGIIETIEKSKDNIALAAEFIERSGLSDKIQIIEGDALSVMPSLQKKYNLIFLDADKEDYEKLFYYSLMLLKKGGIIFIDNLLWHGYTAATRVPSSYKKSTRIIREFNRLFLEHPALNATILPVGDGIGLGVKIK